jgi:hypothetical protein
MAAERRWTAAIAEGQEAIEIVETAEGLTKQHAKKRPITHGSLFPWVLVARAQSATKSKNEMN